MVELYFLCLGHKVRKKSQKEEGGQSLEPQLEAGLYLRALHIRRGRALNTSFPLFLPWASRASWRSSRWWSHIAEQRRSGSPRWAATVLVPHPALAPALENHPHETAWPHCSSARSPWRLEWGALPARYEGWSLQLTHLLLHSHCKTDTVLVLRYLQLHNQVGTRLTAQWHLGSQWSGAEGGSWSSCHSLGYWESLCLQLALSSSNSYLPSPAASALHSLSPWQDQAPGHPGAFRLLRLASVRAGSF